MFAFQRGPVGPRGTAGPPGIAGVPGVDGIDVSLFVFAVLDPPTVNGGATLNRFKPKREKINKCCM